MKSLNRYLFEGNIEFPEEIKKLTNRSSDIEIDNAIATVLNLDFNNDDSLLNSRKIDDFQKDVLKSTRRHTKYLSKTAVIEKIKDRFKKNVKDAEEKKKLEEHNKYLASPEGKRRQKEADEKIKKIEDYNESQKEDMLKELKNAISKYAPEVTNVYTDDFRYMSIEVNSKRRLELMNDDRNIDEKPVYKVSVAGYGYITPDEEEVSLVKTTYVLLTNKTVINTIKSICDNVRNLIKDSRTKLNAIRTEYKDLYLDLSAELY